MFPNQRKYGRGSGLASALLALMVGISAPSVGAADGETVFDGSKARVNVSGVLRMLTQRIESGSCRIAAGFDAENARSDLIKARDDFKNILSALRNGDTALGIPNAEDFSRVLISLDKVQAAWEPVELATDQILAGDNVADAAARVAVDGDTLLNATFDLSAEITARYTNPAELLQGDAMSIGIAGRQGLFTQQMSVQVCGMAADMAVFGTPEQLKETAETFDRTLIALRDGEPTVGIAPPPEQVAGQITKAYETWNEERGLITAYLDGSAEPSNESVTRVVATGDALLKEMNNVVTLYMLSTPGKDDVYVVPLQDYSKRVLSQWLTDPDLIAALKAQNDEHAALSLDQIEALDQEWRAEAKAGGGALIERLLGHPVSGWLKQQQDATAGFVTEVFVMDNRGLNVAQSVETSDYWQGDEAKWKQTYGNGSGDTHISEVEFDDSTQFYQSQVSMPITDPETGKLIGAVTFGINVQSLL